MVLRITDVKLGGKSAAADKRKADADAKTERQRLEEAAAKQAAEDAAFAAKLAKAAGREGAGQGRRKAAAKATAKTAAKSAAKTDGQGLDGEGRRRRPRAPRPRAARPTRSRRAKAEAEAARHEEGRVDPMAHKKAGSSSKNGRDSVGQRLGVKVGDGQLVPAGSIIVRQRGMTFLAGTGTGLGRDYTVFATTDRQGQVRARHQEQEADPGRGRRGPMPAPAAAGRQPRTAALPRPDAQQSVAGDHRLGHGPARTASEERTNVKPDIHPKYYEAKVHCGSCGTEWTVGSTRPELRVDVCSNCHPFFTGKQTIIDTAGQVERFQKRLERSARA